MGCKHCQSSREEAFQGEITLAFLGIQRIEQVPLYLCPQIQVCLDCGAAGFFISGQELEFLRKGMVTSDSCSDASQT